MRCQREAGVGLAGAEHQVRDVTAHRGAVFESMAAATADQPDIRPARMLVDQQIAVVAVLILADPGLGEWTLGESREATREIGPHIRKRLIADPAISGIRIELRPMNVQRDLE